MAENKPKDKKESSKELAKINKKILTSIPLAIPHEKIKLEKLPDGYKLKVNHKSQTEDEKGSIESSFVYETEEHYGMEVKDVKGKFNENGFYEVSIDFLNK